jgi:hypothetical protein
MRSGRFGQRFLEGLTCACEPRLRAEEFPLEGHGCLVVALEAFWSRKDREQRDR